MRRRSSNIPRNPSSTVIVVRFAKLASLRKGKHFKVSQFIWKNFNPGKVCKYLSTLFCSLCILVHSQTFVEFDFNLFTILFCAEAISFIMASIEMAQSINCKSDFFSHLNREIICYLNLPVNIKIKVWKFQTRYFRISIS